jgi:hypothetical protein
MVYSGSVLDLNLLQWFNTSQVTYPAQFDDLRKNPAVKGWTSHAFQSGADKRLGQCLSEIIRVGSIDTETVGCIASKVVLYVSLVFILSIVLVKFLLALSFQWFFSRRFAASKSPSRMDSKKRNRQIEDWSDDIYRPLQNSMIQRLECQIDPASVAVRSCQRRQDLPVPTQMSAQRRRTAWHPLPWPARLDIPTCSTHADV